MRLHKIELYADHGPSEPRHLRAETVDLDALSPAAALLAEQVDTTYRRDGLNHRAYCRHLRTYAERGFSVERLRMMGARPDEREIQVWNWGNTLDTRETVAEYFERQAALIAAQGWEPVLPVVLTR